MTILILAVLFVNAALLAGVLLVLGSMSKQLNLIGLEVKQIMATQDQENALLDKIASDLASAKQSISAQIADLKQQIASGAVVPDDVIERLTAIDDAVNGLGGSDAVPVVTE
jgi:Tfp pilus assembly protein PilN